MKPATFSISAIVLTATLLSNFGQANSITNELAPCSIVTLKWAKVIEIADVTFAASDCTSFESAHNSKNKSLKFHFHRQVSARFFERAANNGFIDNLRLQNTETEHDLSLSQQFNKKYQDMQPGDEYLIQQNESTGIKLFKNDVLIATQSDLTFSVNYLNIWLGNKPAIKKLKSLLENSFN